jgi:2-oxoglutarate dehydrogenase E1 component
MAGFLSEERPVQTLRQVLARLKQAYCGSVGYEYMHISDRERCNWLRERIETPTARAYSQRRKLIMLDRLAWADLFEAFLSNKYSAAKRFGLEGAETLIPGMKELIDRAAELEVDSIVIGMPHRGRLNVLANVVRKPLSSIFAEFAGGVRPAASLGAEEGVYTGSGDVKYHLGTSYDRPTLRGGAIHLSLVANPSHLEAVNTVVQGKVRAKQYYDKDAARGRTLPVLLHGDGAFAGQGIVYESLDMSQLNDYTVGGTIHIVVNNQVAFTTDPKASRSSPYCTDVAKGLGVPVFHVNGDDVEAVAHACELAVEWRQRWKADVVVDLVCYRRYGHNEIDDPMFTQPLMYKVIRAHRNAHQQYADRLVREGSVSPEEVAAIQNRVQAVLESEFAASKSLAAGPADWLAERSHWGGFKAPNQLSRIRMTGVPMELLADVGRVVTTLPDGFTPHRAIARVYDARRAALAPGAGAAVDWALAEALAFGTLIREGFHVRLSGQDVERGTFSHRHAVLHDQATGSRYRPLCAAGSPGLFTVSNSSLSEFGVLGFELGYSMESPAQLVLWEAQFGDFANGAQVIIDQFISSGEAKWLRQSGLVMLLPHGYDGQGPEHSSARLERYLQACDEDAFAIPDMASDTRRQIQNANWQVCNVTTPANYFHLLRRQVHRDFRKPLIVMAPKNLLRHPKCRSALSEFDDQDEGCGEAQGTRFKRLIMDASASDRSLTPTPQPDVRRLVFCSGKVYYELDAEREAAAAAGGALAEPGTPAGGVAICRVEQLSPFPWDLVARELRRYPQAQVVWAQEEPQNMGAFFHVLPRLQTVLAAEQRAGGVRYAGRPPAASTATGFGGAHATEQAALLRDALAL